jgi:protein-tyrosine phosphatase
VIDLHCHILPGIDDGAPTPDDALAMARIAVEAGTKTIVATPHVSWEWPDNDSHVIADKVTELNEAIRGAGLDLEIRPGAEIAMSRAAELDDDELRALSLGGGPWLLIECPFVSSAAGFDLFLSDLQTRGHQIVLAHPERCPAFQREPARLRSFLGQGMLSSITAGSLVGRFGRTVKAFAEDLMSTGLVDSVASDAHDAGPRRAPGITPILEGAGFGAQADWLARAVPLAVLRGTKVPPRPQAEARGSRSVLGLVGERKVTWR